MASRAKRLVSIEYDAKTKRAVASIGQLTDEVKKLTTGWRDLSARMALVNRAIGVARSTFQLVGRAARFAAEAIEAFSAQETQLRQVGRAVESLGISWAATRDQVIAFGEAQQDVTRFGDTDTFQAMQRLASALGDMQVSYLELERATKLVLDIVEATGKSSNEAARLVARAMAGVTEGLNEVVPGARQTLEAIKGMGDASQRTAALMRLLEQSFGGAAEEISETDQRVAEARNIWGDFTEFVGGALVEVVIAADRFGEGLGRLDEAVLLLSGSNYELGNSLLGIADDFESASERAARAWRKYVAANEGFISATESAFQRQIQRVDVLRAAVLGFGPEALLDPATGGPLPREQIEEFFEVQRILQGLSADDLSLDWVDDLGDDLGRSTDRTHEMRRGLMALHATLAQIVLPTVAAGEALRALFDPSSRPSGLAESLAKAEMAASLLAETLGEASKTAVLKRLADDARLLEIKMNNSATAVSVLNNALNRLRNLAPPGDKPGSDPGLGVTGGLAPKPGELEDAWGHVMTGIEGAWVGGLGGMQTALAAFITGAEGSWADFGKNLATSIGQSFSSIGIALIAGGGAAGPFGIPLLLLGFGFSLAASLLGGGGGAGGGRARSSDVTAGIRPLASANATSSVTYIVQAGAVFTTRDTSRRAIAELVDESVTLGELTVG